MVIQGTQIIHNSIWIQDPVPGSLPCEAMDAPRALAARCLDEWRPVIDGMDEPDYASLIPEVSKEDFGAVLEAVIPVLQRQQSALVETSGKFIYVGDIHGAIEDLCRLIACFGFPPANRFVFLGDYVDRGPNSVAVLTVICCMLILWPNDVIALRGNHEFSHLNKPGFGEECATRFGRDDGDRLWTLAQQVFSHLPLASSIDGAFAVHGGLSPLARSIDDIRRIHLPIQHYIGAQIVSDLVWSDPSDIASGFMKNSRGCGQVFGRDRTEAFLKENGLKLLIRAHQLAYQGYHVFHAGLGVSLFSASNYSGGVNRSGCLILSETGAHFYSCDCGNEQTFLPRHVMKWSGEGEQGLRTMFTRAGSRPDLKPDETPSYGLAGMPRSPTVGASFSDMGRPFSIAMRRFG